MAPSVEILTKSFELGEGPHWDVASQSLYFVDIFGKSINKYNPATQKHTSAVIGQPASTIIPIQGQNDKFLVTFGRNVAIITWDGESEEVSDITKIAEVDADQAETRSNRINDGKCDALGRLWAGTMGEEKIVGQFTPDMGTFYSFDGSKTKAHFKGVGISNGITWNKDNTKMFYVDSLKKSIDQFDFDLKSGSLSNRTILFDLEKNGIEGLPDGLTIDTEDNLWLAVFYGSKIIQVDTKKSNTVLQNIAIPAKQTTSVAFGGANLDELYVTSGSLPINGEILPAPNGATFKVTGLSAKGFPANNFRL